MRSLRLRRWLIGSGVVTMVPASGPASPPRTLAPDLARGLMLLFIAIANVPWHLWGGSRRGVSSHPEPVTALDHVAQAVTVTAIDQRIYPMFAFLFGYGMVQFADGRAARGVSVNDVRRMLRRRHWSMLLLGVLHAALLFNGDILGAYGLVGLVTVWLFFKRQDRTLVVWLVLMGLVLMAWVAFSLLGLWAVLAQGVPAGSATIAVGPTDNASYLGSVPERLAGWVLATVYVLVTPEVPACVMLGWLAARHRVLEEPGRHLRLLRVVAVVGIALGLGGGALAAMDREGLLGIPDEAWWGLLVPTMVSGMAGGIGYVALFGLVAHALGDRRPRPVQVAVAVGKRSLSCYLAQSVLFAPLLAAWGLGLGSRIGSAAAMLLACLVWVVIAAGAWALEQAGRRGPAETVLRRLTYGRHDQPATVPAA